MSSKNNESLPITDLDSSKYLAKLAVSPLESIPKPLNKTTKDFTKERKYFFDTWAFGKGSFPWDSFFVVAAVYSRLWSLPIGGQGKYTPTFIGQVPAMWDFNKVTAEGKIDIF
jgi:hypothetical protein